MDTEVPDLLELLREAVIQEKREKQDAPTEAKRVAETRIKAATDRKLNLVRLAYETGATKSTIASCLGIRNLGQVSKLIERAEGLTDGE